MARYIKANPLVAKFLQLENDRNTVKDGNYLLWQADMLKFGPLTLLNETLAQIGGIALMAHEAREEQDGIVTRTLPIATDPRFIIEPVVAASPEVEAPADSGEGEGSGESQEPGETTEETPENGESHESETITAGEIGSVEDLVDFTGESEQTESETPNDQDNE